MEMDGHESDLEGSASNNDEELSDIHDDDSDDHMPRVSEDGVSDADILSKLKQQVRNMERNEEHNQNQSQSTPHENPPGLASFPHQFSLPLPFPFPHPAAAAFLPPTGGAVHPYPAAPPHNSSGSSHSSESSNSSQQQTWSFEEQFKQVRQLYEISDDPKRKEFLDDLFHYMQKRGRMVYTIIEHSMRNPVPALRLTQSRTLEEDEKETSFPVSDRSGQVISPSTDTGDEEIKQEDLEKENEEDEIGKKEENEEIIGINPEEVEIIKEEVVNKKPTYECQKCGKIFLMHKRYMSHTEAHDGPSCIECLKKFTDVRLLNEHVAKKHPKCLKKTSSKNPGVVTATSKFGRTRRVLNVAELRDKYKIL